MSVAAQLCSQLNILPIKVEGRSWPLKFLLEAIMKQKTGLDIKFNDSDYKSEKYVIPRVRPKVL